MKQMTQDVPEAPTQPTASGAAPVVERLHAVDFDRVYPLLERHDPGISKDRWRMLFTCDFPREEEHCGYGLFHKGQVVGYLGLIFSQRSIDGKLERFCNTTTWVVDEAHRHSSLGLMLPALRLKQHTLTDLSPTADVARWCARWGFKELETHARVMWAMGPSRTREPQTTIVTQPDAIAEHLRDSELQIHADHQPHHASHSLLALAGSESCYAVYTRVARSRGLSYAHILHLSNRDLFARQSLQIRKAIAATAGTRFVAVDERHVRGLKLPRAHTVKMTVPRFFRSPTLEAEQVDNLYSELALLGLSSYSIPVPSPRERFAWSSKNGHAKDDA